jgi:hypothetical protein
MEHSILVLRNKNKEIIGETVIDKKYSDILSKGKCSININGYVAIYINKKKHSLHRYIYYELEMNKLDSTTPVVDHINRNKLDNRIENLRAVSHSENCRNVGKSSNATSKYFGVSYSTNKKWTCRLGNSNFTYDIEEHAAYHYDLLAIDAGLYTKLNNIDKPSDFVKREKKLRDLPTGIYIFYSKYEVHYRKKRIGRFTTLEEAIFCRNKAVETHKSDTINNILNTPIKRNSDGYAIIELYNVKREKVAETIVDDDDYYNLMLGTWSLKKHGYVSGKYDKKTYLLHRFIMNYNGKDKINHINSDPLDNRKSNLRIYSNSHNSQYKKSMKNSTSKYIGVCLDETRQKWRASIILDGKYYNLGKFKIEEEAAKARDAKAREFNLSGCSFKLNF